MTCNGRQRQPRGLRCRRAHVARAANPCLPRISELEDFCPTSVRRLNVSFYATLLKAVSYRSRENEIGGFHFHFAPITVT